MGLFWLLLLHHKIPLSGTRHQQWLLELMAWVCQNILPLVRHLVRNILEQRANDGSASGTRPTELSLAQIKQKKTKPDGLIDLFEFGLV